MTDAPKTDVRRYYDDFSASYDESRRSGYHRLLDDLAVELATPYARGARVLELGCGTGAILTRLAQVAEQAVGIDLSEKMAVKARARGLEVHVGDIRALPFPDDEFELTCSFRVLPHVHPIEEALREALRVTSPGGHLLLELYNPWSLRYLAKKLVGPQRISSTRTEADVLTRWDSPRSVRALVPRGAELLSCRGIRVLTPFAALHEVPWVGRGLRRAERAATRSPLGYFGGFLIAVLRKS